MLSKKLVISLALAALTALSACSARDASAPSPGPEPLPAQPTGQEHPSPEQDAGQQPPEAHPLSELLAASIDAAAAEFSSRVAVSPLGTLRDALPGDFTASGTVLPRDDDGTAHPEYQTELILSFSEKLLGISSPAFPEPGAVYALPHGAGLTELAETFISGLDLTRFQGSDGDTVLTAQVSGQELTAFLSDAASHEPAALFLYSAITGDERAYSQNGPGALTDDVLLTFTLSGDVLRRVTASSGEDVLFDASWDGSHLTVSCPALGDVTLTVGEDISLSGFLNYGYGTTVELNWLAGGSLSFIYYSTDVTGLSLEGAFDYSGIDVTFEGFASSGNRGDGCDITLSLTPGAEDVSDYIDLGALPPSGHAQLFDSFDFGARIYG